MLMAEKIQFLKGFIQHPLHVGSFLPSSPATAAAMAKDICPDENAVVLELGCGTGAFTTEIEKVVPTKNAFLGIEINDDFVDLLQQRFPKLSFVNGDAADAYRIHQNSGLGDVKYIISGLPFASLPSETKKSIFDSVDKFMANGCTFRAIQLSTAYYLPSAENFRREMNERYGEMQYSEIVWRNFPPAYVFTWQT